MVPTSLFAHITLTSATPAGSRSMASRSTSGSSRPETVHAEPLDLGAFVLAEPADAVEHGVVLGRGREDAVAHLAGPGLPGTGLAGTGLAVCPARPEQALDRQVVGLRAAAGEDDLAWPGAVGLRYLLARLLDDRGGRDGRRCAARTGFR